MQNDTAPAFNVGDWATHKNGLLDPREVSAISLDRTQIKLKIGADVETIWVPAANYDFKEN